jgi:hypothetical protein
LARTPTRRSPTSRRQSDRRLDRAVLCESRLQKISPRPECSDRGLYEKRWDAHRLRSVNFASRDHRGQESPREANRPVPRVPRAFDAIGRVPSPASSVRHGLLPFPGRTVVGGRSGGNQSRVCTGFSFRDVISAGGPAWDAEKRAIRQSTRSLFAWDSAVDVRPKFGDCGRFEAGGDRREFHRRRGLRKICRRCGLCRVRAIVRTVARCELHATARERTGRLSRCRFHVAGHTVLSAVFADRRCVWPALAFPDFRIIVAVADRAFRAIRKKICSAAQALYRSDLPPC